MKLGQVVFWVQRKEKVSSQCMGTSGPYRSACHHPSEGTGKTLMSRRSEFESKSYQMTLSDLLHQSLRFEKTDYFNCGKVNITGLQCSRPGFDLWVGKIPCRRKRQPTVVFFPGKCHGQRSLAGYSSWGLKSQTRLRDWVTTKHDIKAPF